MKKNVEFRSISCFHLNRPQVALARPLPKIMAISNSKMYNRTSIRLEQAADLEKELGRIDDSIRRLKIEFDIYFAGAVKRPPLEAKARLESQLKRVSDIRTLNFAQRYQLNALMARFTSYRELWRRTMRARGDEFC